MKLALPLIAALVVSTPAFAQDTVGTGANQLSFDLGLGAVYKPSYRGSDELEASPWLIMRNLRVGGVGGEKSDGFSLSPSVDLVGTRDSDDDERLTGLDEIDRAYELGLKGTYKVGATTAYGTMRKGFGGHKGVTGELGATYRFETTDRMTFWAGVEAGYGNGKYNETYFGISDDEAARTDFSAYSLDGGFNSAAVSLEGRYELNSNTAILGAVKFSRIIGDAADSPIVEDRNQPSVKLGIVRTLNFAF